MRAPSQKAVFHCSSFRLRCRPWRDDRVHHQRGAMIDSLVVDFDGSQDEGSAARHADLVVGLQELLSPRQQGSRPRIKRDCETVVFGAVEHPIVPPAAPVVGVPQPLNPVHTVNASVWTTTGVQTPCDRFSVGVSVSWGRRTRGPTAGSRRPWHVTGFQRVALNRHVAPGLHVARGKPSAAPSPARAQRGRRPPA